jgi:diguanylate cyclase (GGDEF)-like protein
MSDNQQGKNPSMMTLSMPGHPYSEEQAARERQAILKHRRLLFVLLLVGAPLSLSLFFVSLLSGPHWGAAVAMLLWIVLMSLGVSHNRRGLQAELARAERADSVERLYQEMLREHQLADHLRKLAATMALEFDGEALGSDRLLEQMRRAHTDLEAQREEAAAQAEAMLAMNQKLLTVQAELEAQYRALEFASATSAALAITDGMTGLANHRAFQEELNRQMARANRSQSSVALLLLDVDFFKQFNDTYGHPAGDDILETVASIIQNTVREGDYPARYGGEEFAVILPDTRVDSGLLVAERIRSAIANYPFPHRKITVSIGITASLPTELSNCVIQRADVALYEAKSAGRNCVKIFLPVDTEANDAEECLESEREESLFAPLPAIVEAESGPPLVSPFSASGEEIYSEEETLPCLRDRLDGGLEGLLQTPPALVLAELLDTLDYRHEQPPGHSERVIRYALRLGHALAALYDEQRTTRPLLPRLTLGHLADLSFGALLHDIGKSGIPASILRKVSKLTEEEWRQIRRHPLVGAELILGRPLLARALPVVRFHHERWDGTGYPQGLSGESIPLEARIFAVCDTLDTLLNDKPYRPRLDFSAASDEIVRASGTQFDPDVVAAFLSVPEQDWLALSNLKHPPLPVSRSVPKAA